MRRRRPLLFVSLLGRAASRQAAYPIIKSTKRFVLFFFFSFFLLKGLRDGIAGVLLLPAVEVAAGCLCRCRHYLPVANFSTPRFSSLAFFVGWAAAEAIRSLGPTPGVLLFLFFLLRHRSLPPTTIQPAAAGMMTMMA